MEDKKLKEMMDRFSIPESDENAREETLKAAMTEFRAQTEKKQQKIKKIMTSLILILISLRL